MICGSAEDKAACLKDGRRVAGREKANNKFDYCIKSGI